MRNFQLKKQNLELLHPLFKTDCLQLKPNQEKYFKILAIWMPCAITGAHIKMIQLMESVAHMAPWRDWSRLWRLRNQTKNAQSLLTQEKRQKNGE